jgi:lysophospholipase L1-like esterase
MKKALIVLTLAALLGAVPATAQVDFTRYVAVGDSLTAGYVSGGLVQYYQDRSYPALLAQQAGAPVFEMPTVSEPGLAPLLELLALVPAPVIQRKPGAPGLPTNVEYPAPYNNLGVPGANVYDLVMTTGDIWNLLAGNTDNVMHDLILRTPAAPDGTPATALVQAIAQDPTFVTVWIGNNDILGAAVSGTPIDGITMTPIDVFEQLYGQALGALATMTNAKIVAINLPDSTSIPFLTTISNYITIPGMGTFQLMGEDGPIEDDDYITLAASALIAQGYGLPGGPPLPENLDLATGAYGVILRAEEAAIVNERTAAFNAIIAATAANFGIPVLDMNARFNEIAGGDRWILGGIELSADFLLGGIFSYDGVHPQNIGYGLVATELINTINSAYDANIPQLNMADILYGGGAVTLPVGTNAKDVVFSQSAWDSLKEVFPINLPHREGLSDETPSAID